MMLRKELQAIHDQHSKQKQNQEVEMQNLISELLDTSKTIYGKESGAELKALENTVESLGEQPKNMEIDSTLSNFDAICNLVLDNSTDTTKSESNKEMLNFGYDTVSSELDKMSGGLPTINEKYSPNKGSCKTKYFEKTERVRHTRKTESLQRNTLTKNVEDNMSTTIVKKTVKEESSDTTIVKETVKEESLDAIESQSISTRETVLDEWANIVDNLNSITSNITDNDKDQVAKSSFAINEEEYPKSLSKEKIHQSKPSNNEVLSRRSEDGNVEVFILDEQSFVSNSNSDPLDVDHGSYDYFSSGMGSRISSSMESSNFDLNDGSKSDIGLSFSLKSVETDSTY